MRRRYGAITCEELDAYERIDEERQKLLAQLLEEALARPLDAAGDVAQRERTVAETAEAYRVRQANWKGRS